MTTHVWTKPETQKTIKALRDAGYNVEKKNDMYIINIIVDGLPIFRAMKGKNSYLVYYISDLFGPEE